MGLPKGLSTIVLTSSKITIQIYTFEADALPEQNLENISGYRKRYLMTVYQLKNLRSPPNPLWQSNKMRCVKQDTDLMSGVLAQYTLFLFLNKKLTYKKMRLKL